MDSIQNIDGEVDPERTITYDEIKNLKKNFFEKLQTKLSLLYSNFSQGTKEMINHVYWIFWLKEVKDDRNIWKMYYAEESLKRAYRELQFLKIREEIKEKLGDPRRYGLYDIALPENTEEDVFKYSYLRSAYYRCINEMYQKVSGKTLDSQKDLLYGMQQILIFDNLEGWIAAVFGDVKFTFNIFEGMKKDILYIALCKRKNPVSKKTVSTDGMVYCGGRRIDYVWGITEENEGYRGMKLKQYFSPAYQIKTKNDSSLKKLFLKGTCKNCTFQFSLKNGVDIDQCMDYFEQYILEDKTEIMSSWKLYNATAVLIGSSDMSKKNENPVFKLAQSIGKIHNLEARCWVLEEIEKILPIIYADSNRNVFSEIQLLSDTLNSYALRFNRIYDKMFKITWEAIKEENWKYFLPTKNNETVFFSQLQKQIHKMLWKRGNNPINRENFQKLYRADGRYDEYTWYKNIGEGLRNDRGWIINLIS